MRNVATTSEEGRKSKEVCGAHLRYEQGPKCCGKCCTLCCDAGPFARLWGGRLWIELRLLTATPDWDPLLHVWQPFVSGGKLRR